MSILKFLRPIVKEEPKLQDVKEDIPTEEVVVVAKEEEEGVKEVIDEPQITRLRLGDRRFLRLLPVCLSPKEVAYFGGSDRLQCIELTKCGKYIVLSHSSSQVRIYPIRDIQTQLDGAVKESELPIHQLMEAFVSGTLLPRFLKHDLRVEALSHQLCAHLTSLHSQSANSCSGVTQEFFRNALHNTAVQYALKNPSVLDSQGCKVVLRLPESNLVTATKYPSTQLFPQFHSSSLKLSLLYNTQLSKCFGDLVTLGSYSAGLDAHSTGLSNCAFLLVTREFHFYGLNDGSVMYVYGDTTKKLVVPIVSASIACLAVHGVRQGISSKIVHQQLEEMSNIQHVVTANGTSVQYIWNAGSRTFEQKTRANIASVVLSVHPADRELTTVFVDSVHMHDGLQCAVLTGDLLFIQHQRSRQFEVKKVVGVGRCVDIAKVDGMYRCIVSTAVDILVLNVFLEYKIETKGSVYNVTRDLSRSNLSGSDDGEDSNDDNDDENDTTKVTLPIPTITTPPTPKLPNIGEDPFKKKQPTSANTQIPQQPTKGVNPFSKQDAVPFAKMSTKQPFQVPLHGKSSSILPAAASTHKRAQDAPTDVAAKNKVRKIIYSTCSSFVTISASTDSIPMFPTVCVRVVDCQTVVGTPCRRVSDVKPEADTRYGAVLNTVQHFIHQTTDINSVLSTKQTIVQLEREKTEHDKVEIQGLFASNKDTSTSSTPQRDTHTVDRGTSRRRQLDLVAEEITAVEAMFGEAVEKKHVLDARIKLLAAQDRFRSSQFTHSDAALQLKKKYNHYDDGSKISNGHHHLSNPTDLQLFSWGMGQSPGHVLTMINTAALNLRPGNIQHNINIVKHALVDTLAHHGFSSATDMQTHKTTENITCVKKLPDRDTFIVGLSSGQIRFVQLE